MPRDEFYLNEILEACELILEFVEKLTIEEFVNHPLIRSAVAMQFVVIGEAANHVSSAVQVAHEQIPWKDLVGFRNIVAHRYKSVDWTRVWFLIEAEVPGLLSKIATILSEDY